MIVSKKKIARYMKQYTRVYKEGAEWRAELTILHQSFTVYRASTKREVAWMAYALTEALVELGAMLLEDVTAGSI